MTSLQLGAPSHRKADTGSWLAARLAEFPSVSLGGVSPVQEARRLAAAAGVAKLLLKRDDLGAIGGGGNKLRKLNFLLADAIQHGADIVLTSGAIQSNHARLTAASSARLGLQCRLALVRSGAPVGPEYLSNGNAILHTLFGARVDIYPPGTDGAEVLPTLAAEEETAGRRPYVIPAGGSNALGTLGYVAAGLEVAVQLATRGGEPPDTVVIPSGSGGTQAGLAVGLAAAGFCPRLIGISVGTPATKQAERVRALVRDTMALLCFPDDFRPLEIEVTDAYIGPAYGIPTRSTYEALVAMARLEGVLSDPVYTGKAVAAVLAGAAGRGSVLFWHTGGTWALPGYVSYLHAPTTPLRTHDEH